MAQFFQVIWRRHRDHLTSPELNSYPATPAGYYAGYYPGSQAVQANRISFKTRIQHLPELNSYPVTPIEVPYPSYLSPKSYKVSYKALLQKLPELNTYPVTPPAAVVYPWITEVTKTRNNTNRKRLDVELNIYPQTPGGYYTGYYPGSIVARSFKFGFKVSLQRLPELNTYPSAIVAAPISAWLTHFEKTRNTTNRQFLSVELNNYPITSPEYYTGYYPGSAVVKSFRLRGKTKLQNVPELNVYPVIPPSVAPVIATVSIQIPTKNYTNRKQQYSTFRAELATLWGLIDGKTSYSIKGDYGSVILYPQGINYFTFEEYADEDPGNIQYRGEDGQLEASSSFSWDKYNKILHLEGKIHTNGNQVLYDAEQANFAGALFLGNGGEKLKHTSGFEGYYNTGVGFETLIENTTGYYNTALGYGCLRNNTTGNFNFAIGTFSLEFTTIGNYNTAIGNGSLNRNNEGDHNVGCGSFTGFHNLTGDYNTFVGNFAGAGVYLSSDIIGNVACGFRAGFNLQTGANYNTLIGYQAGDAISTGSYNIAIGYNIDVVSPTSDYQVTIGDIIKGEYGATKKLGFFGTTPVEQPAGYTAFTNLNTDKTCDADATSVEELADILGTLIEDLKTMGIIKS